MATKSPTGWGADRYEKRVHVKRDGATVTTYAARYPEGSWGRANGKYQYAEISQQAYSKVYRQNQGRNCFVVVTAENGVEVRFG